jgi:hypothetical protein
MGFNFDCLLGFSLGVSGSTCSMSVEMNAVTTTGWS